METSKTTNIHRAKIVVTIARVFGTLALFALIFAWITKITGGSIMEMNQQHFFFDSIALSLISIGNLFDALLHFKNLV